MNPEKGNGSGSYPVSCCWAWEFLEILVSFLCAGVMHFHLGSDYRANLALNPFQSFFSSLKFSKSGFNLGKVKKAYPLLKPYFDFTGDSVNLNYDRSIQSAAGPTPTEYRCCDL